VNDSGTSVDTLLERYSDNQEPVKIKRERERDRKREREREREREK